MTSQPDYRPPSALARGVWLALPLMAALAIGPGCGEANKYQEPPPPEGAANGLPKATTP